MRGSLFAQMQRIMRTRAAKPFQLLAVVRASSLSQPSPPPSSAPSASAALLASARPLPLRPPPSQDATAREAEVPSSSGRTEPVTLDPKLLSGCVSRMLSLFFSSCRAREEDSLPSKPPRGRETKPLYYAFSPSNLPNILCASHHKATPPAPALSPSLSPPPKTTPPLFPPYNTNLYIN